MVGINIKDAKASSTPKAIAKYVTAGKNSVKLNKENVCKMFNGEGFKNKVYDYQAKDVTALCGGECQIRGTMHGKHVTTFTNLVGYTGCKGQPGLHILIHHDGNKHYKMVGINIKDAKASSTPKAIAKYVTAGKGSVKLTNENVCKMFKGEGYSPKVYDYEAKDVTVVCGGSPSADAPAACFSFKVSNVDACGFSNVGLRTKKGTNGKGMTIEECRAACRKNSACTGIQYSSKNPNCDLIVKNCDFDKKFKKSSGAEWLVESRTCFDGAVVDTCKTNNGGCDSKRKCTESGSFKRAPKGDGYKCPENNKNRLFKALNKTPKECAALCEKNAQCKYFTTSKESPSKYCIGCKVAPVAKHPGAITYVVSRTGGGVTCGNCPAGYANDGAKGCKGSFTRATKFDGYKCPENHKNRVFKALHKTPKECAALCEKNAQCKYFSTGSPSQYCIGCKVAPATKHPGATSYVMS